LEGELMMMALVRGVMWAAMASAETAKPSASDDSTKIALPPA